MSIFSRAAAPVFSHTFSRGPLLQSVTAFRIPTHSPGSTVLLFATPGHGGFPPHPLPWPLIAHRTGPMPLREATRHKAVAAYTNWLRACIIPGDVGILSPAPPGAIGPVASLIHPTSRYKDSRKFVEKVSKDHSFA